MKQHMQAAIPADTAAAWLELVSVLELIEIQLPEPLTEGCADWVIGYVSLLVSQLTDLPALQGLL